MFCKPWMKVFLELLRVAHLAYMGDHYYSIPKQDSMEEPEKGLDACMSAH